MTRHAARLVCVLVMVVLFVAPLPLTTAGARYDGVSLKWLTIAGHNSWIVKVHQEAVKRELGIDLVPVEVKEGQEYEKAMTDWATGGGAYDIVTALPAYNGDFMAGGYLIPLDTYFKKIEGAQRAYDDIIKEFRVLCTQWGGRPYAFAQDGDVYNLYYRKDILTKPEIRSGFKKKYGYDLPVPPRTWKELEDAAEYLNGWDWDGDGKPEYGYTQVWKVALYRIFLPTFGSASGGRPVFDSKMNPQINNAAGAQVLNDLRRLIKLGPPGASSHSYAETTAAFINGEAAFHWFWGDIAKMIYTPGWSGDPKEVGPQWKNRIGYAIMPGYFINGKLSSYSDLAGKIIGVTKYCKNPEAAVAALAFLSQPERNYLTVDSSTTGSDVFSYSALKRKADQWNVKIDQAFLDLIPDLMSRGYPSLSIPGGQEYIDVLDRNISRFLVDDSVSAKDTLADIENEWEKITERRGRDKQIKIWQEFLRNMKELGLDVE